MKSGDEFSREYILKCLLMAMADKLALERALYEVLECFVDAMSFTELPENDNGPGNPIIRILYKPDPIENAMNLLEKMGRKRASVKRMVTKEKNRRNGR